MGVGGRGFPECLQCVHGCVCVHVHGAHTHVCVHECTCVQHVWDRCVICACARTQAHMHCDMCMRTYMDTHVDACRRVACTRVTCMCVAYTCAVCMACMCICARAHTSRCVQCARAWHAHTRVRVWYAHTHVYTRVHTCACGTHACGVCARDTMHVWYAYVHVTRTCAMCTHLHDDPGAKRVCTAGSACTRVFAAGPAPPVASLTSGASRPQRPRVVRGAGRHAGSRGP